MERSIRGGFGGLASLCAGAKKGKVPISDSQVAHPSWRRVRQCKEITFTMLGWIV